ncbi:hypothetical protein MMC31_003782 [Peltigera leucophlebia]|nr:hypothetical protein [Peltigera leucophlebia]
MHQGKRGKSNQIRIIRLISRGRINSLGLPDDFSRSEIFAKYYESPPYRNPVGDLSEEDIERLQFPDVSAIDSAAFTMEGEYGPVVYKGYTWAAVRSIYRSMEEELGDRTSGEGRESNGQFNCEFLKVDPANDATVFISSQHLLNEVKDDLQHLACFRFVKAMIEREKLGDQEYQPSSETEEE